MANFLKTIMKQKNCGAMDLATAGLSVVSGYSEYKAARQNGHGAIVSAGAAIGDFALGEMLGLPGMIGLGVLEAAPQLAASAYTGINKAARQMSRQRYGNMIPFYNATFQDTQQAYTMRQAGMQLAENSKYNLQQSLMGNEAAMLHM